MKGSLQRQFHIKYSLGSTFKNKLWCIGKYWSTLGSKIRTCTKIRQLEKWTGLNMESRVK